MTFTALDTNQTEIHVILKYEPPAGAVGSAVAKLFSDPQKQLTQDLERFKTIVNQQNTYDQGSGPEANVRGA